MIDEAAIRMINGIENIEVFLEENDQWQFHDSNIKPFIGMIWNVDWTLLSVLLFA